MKKSSTTDRIPDSPEAIERAALADPDAKPLTDAAFKRMRRTPQAKIIRRALNLTQEEFALRYHIPPGTLRDWEQGRSQPDQPTRAYLTVIARDPEHVARVLNRGRNQIPLVRLSIRLLLNGQLPSTRAPSSLDLPPPGKQGNGVSMKTTCL